MRRVVVPEILDSLCASHPEAIRSRRDLKVINTLMGNERWILNQLKKLPRQTTPHTIYELGAGEGQLTQKIHRQYPTVTGLDLVKKPAHLPADLHWLSGDLFQLPSTVSQAADIVIANLFLHHFEFAQIHQIIAKFPQAQTWIINEPHRSSTGIMLSKLMNPFVNAVTEHDMDLSIRAGFDLGEFNNLLPANDWQLHESTDFRGAYRLIAKKNIAQRKEPQP